MHREPFRDQVAARCLRAALHVRAIMPVVPTTARRQPRSWPCMGLKLSAAFLSKASGGLLCTAKRCLQPIIYLTNSDSD